MSERKREGRLPGQNSCELQYYHRIWRNPNQSGKQILEDYYAKIWNAIYVNSANVSHTKLFIPTIFHRISLPLWPNFLLAQFLTNHCSFRSYLHKMNKTPSPNCSSHEKAMQTASHLLLEFSIFSNDRPPSIQIASPHLWFWNIT